MLKAKKIVFIGAGVMGSALIRSLIAAKKITPRRCSIIDINPGRRRTASRQFGIPGSSHYEPVRSADIVVVAVKPQQMEECGTDIRTFLPRSCMVVSIAAGISTRWFEKRLGTVPVVRAMPNTPLTIGCGMTAITFGRYAKKSHGRLATALFDAAGTVIPVPESRMDAVTAVSGSGPAYVMYLAESMMSAAIRLGLSKNVARELTVQTIAGSGLLLTLSGLAPEVIRGQVTSKKGTTEAALHWLEQRGVKKIFIEAIRRAHKRSAELSRL